MNKQILIKFYDIIWTRILQTYYFMRFYVFDFTEIFSPTLFTEKMWRFYRDLFKCYNMSVNFTKHLQQK